MPSPTQPTRPTTSPVATEEDLVLDANDFDDGEGLAVPLPEAGPVDLVTVLHGYGRVSGRKVNYLENYAFTGGVCRNIPRKKADEWRNLPGFKIIILPNEATDADYAKAAGIRPVGANRLAAFIAAADKDALITALGPAKAHELIEELAKRLQRRATR